MRFNRSQVQALALLHTLLGGFVVLALYLIQEPVAEWVIVSIFAVYVEVKIWQLIRKGKQ